jgi:hypothetical protein
MTEQLTPDTDMVGGTPQPDQGMVASKKRQARPANFRTRGAATSRDASDAVDYEALARFRYELRKFQEFSKAAANKAGLTPQQHSGASDHKRLFQQRSCFCRRSRGISSHPPSYGGRAYGSDDQAWPVIQKRR